MNETFLDVVASVFLLGGAVLGLGAGVGLVRFPDLLARAHAATKPQVLGLLLVLVGLGVRLREGHVLWMLVLVAVFQLLTSPVAAHMVSRAGYRTGKVDSSRLVVDELVRDMAAADRQAADRAVRPDERDERDERDGRAAGDGEAEQR